MVDWPEKYIIKWVEWRIMGFEARREKAGKGSPVDDPEYPLSELDLKIWLANKRDKKSLSVIAKEQYRRDWKASTGKRGNQVTISRIRRSVAKVEKFLDRGRPGFKGPKKWQKAMDAALNDWLGRG